MIKPYLYKWTKLNAKLNSLTCLNFITRIPNTVDTDTDVGTAEAISKIIALHATYKARVFKVEEKVFKSQHRSFLGSLNLTIEKNTSDD